MSKVKIEFRGFCGDNMGKKGPKTLNIWGSIFKKKTHPRRLKFTRFSTMDQKKKFFLYVD